MNSASRQGADDPIRVSPDEASQTLDGLAADQVAVRSAAVPPQWFVVMVSVLVGGLFAVIALPEPWQWLGTAIAGLGDVAVIVALVWRRNHVTVRLGTFALFTPARPGLILIIAWIAMILIAVPFLLPSMQDHFPWWACLCTGLVIGILTYTVMSWAWRSWARIRP